MGETKTLLVLGCGYLGRLVVREGLDRGMRVLAVSRNEASLAEVKDWGAGVFVGQVEEDAWHEFAGDEVDFVVNCVSSAGGGLAGYRVSYIGGNESLARWAKRFRFEGSAVYTSSVSVYGDAGGRWVDEVSASEPGSERGALVMESEQAFLDGLDGTRAIVLRLAGLYGPGRHLMLNRLREHGGELPGWGDYYLNLVRIEDVTDAVWTCIDEPEVRSGIYSVADDEPALKEEIVAWLAEKLGIQAPKFSGKRDGSGRSSRRLGENGRPANRRIKNSRLKSVSSWQPTFPSFREGFEDLIREG